jgi:beta-lactamase regulating signal transducer with metallopeptidase domain
MTAPYLFRLLCLSLASFFVVNALLGLALSAVSRRVIQIADKFEARHAARFLFILRLLPALLGATAVFGLCVPSYLWLEPNGAPERVGIACLVLAFLGALGFTVSFARTVRAIAASLRCNKSWQASKAENSSALIVPSDAPLLALAGVLQPRLIISKGVLRALSSDELNVALLHENAHCSSRDNLKRLLLLLVPDAIPFVSLLHAFEQSWARFREWAADDEAVQGDAHRALSLASALLRVARMGTAPKLSCLHTSLVAADCDLSGRVERLLRPIPIYKKQLIPLQFSQSAAAFLVVTSLTAMLLWPAALSPVHRLLEQLLR